MLQLKKINKVYPTGGGESVQALRDVDLSFRDSEFVAILGPSGCGKTTLLNIIGGLDQYTSGDLVINGRSTKEYRDQDWDAYRNHSIGFVFQTYNLIPHQSVLQNVELALTLSGVSKKERRQRAEEALRRVGLESQMRKKPNQMSGGQMQRVAIARALVNNPDILLADEPTGALDSETSVQVMEILKEIAKDRLIIMVTHNPDLAERYATRTVRLLDGKVTDDSDPVAQEDMTVSQERQKPSHKKLPAMSLKTALGLSLNNLMTKKARTLLTAFAGSIGIIGIALILSLSTGIQNYIDQVQEDTLSSYPITIEAEQLDMSSMLTSLMGVRQEREEESPQEEGRVYSSTVMYDLINSLVNAEVETNNLRALKKYLEQPDNEIAKLATIRYGYHFAFDVYTTDETGRVIKGDASTLMQNAMAALYGGDFSSYFSSMGAAYSGVDVWEELLPGEDGELVSRQVQGQYDLLYGHWPQADDEMVLFVSEQNRLSDLMLYTLGYISEEEMTDTLHQMMKGETLEVKQRSWTYEELCQTNFKMILPAEYYQKDVTGHYTNLLESDEGIDYLYNSKDVGIPLKIVGIARPNKDAVASMVRGAIGYTSALTARGIKKTEESAIVKEQMADQTTDVFNGLPFATGEETEPTAEEKQAAIKEVLQAMGEQEKAAVYLDVMGRPSEAYVQGIVAQQMAGMTREKIEAIIIQQYAEKMGVDAATVNSYIADMDDATLMGMMSEAIAQQIKDQYAQTVRKQLSARSVQELAAAMNMTLQGSGMMPGFTQEQYEYLYQQYMPDTLSDSNYDKNMRRLGYVDSESPARISIYASTFADKDAVADLLTAYNDSVAEEDQISYTDYVALLMSSITSIINAISYVLIAFVAISLVVSSIMIGIITYISVLERTKEIGILRSIGASKKDVARVFNAETLIEGFVAGAMGIGISLLLTIPINALIHYLTDIHSLSAVLPVGGGIALVLISMFLTFIAGLIPSSIAAKKDPVVALRSE